MKHVQTLLVLFSVLAIASCDNDVPLLSVDRVERPVVFGFLNPGDSIQYVRVERTFSDPQTSAVLLAQDPDAVYYDQLDVRLTTQSGSGSDSESLFRINAVDEGFNRVPGDFLTDPNYLYRSAEDQIELNSGNEVKLEILQNDELLAQSQIKIVGDIRFRAPRLISGQASIAFDVDKMTDIRWTLAPNAGAYTISFDLLIDEREGGTGVPERRILTWQTTSLIYPQISSGDFTYSISGRSFYDFIRSRLDPLPNLQRQLIGLTIYITSYGEEIADYVEIINANSGITSSQEVPRYSNIDGGYGLFSSTKVQSLSNLRLSNESLKELYDGEITGNLGFTP